MQTVILVISFLISVINAPVARNPQSRVSNDAARQNHPVEVQLLTEKHVYKKGDKLNLKVMLINSSDQDIFVYGNLEWGYLASLTLHLRDARGRNVQPRFISDAITYPPDDKSQFVKLLPFHFLGTYYIASIKELNIQNSGKYSVFVEYHSPIPSAKASVSPFFGKEEGIITSNPISIEVQ